MGATGTTQGLGGYNGCFSVSAFAKKVGEGENEIRLFSIKASIPDKGLSLDLGNIMGRDKELEDIHICDGNYGFSNSGAAVVEDYTFSITIGDDYATLLDPVNGFQARDVFKAIVEGGTFNDGNKDKWTVIGTNGVSWIGGDNPLDNQPFGYFLKNDGMLRDPREKDEDGNFVLKGNGRASAFNDTALVMVEMNYRYNSEKSSGYRIPYSLNTSNTFDEGSGAGINKHTLNFKRLSDVITIDKYLADGISDADTLEASAKIKNGLEVDFIISNAGGTAPATAPKADQTALVIDDTKEGAITAYKEGEGAWVEVADVTFEDYVKLYGKDDTVLATTKGGNAVKVYDDKYVIKINKFSYAEEKFLNK